MISYANSDFVDTAPSSPISSEMSLSNIPKLGETAQLTITTHILSEIYNYPTFKIGLGISPGFELVDVADFVFNEEYTQNHGTNQVFTKEILISDSDQKQTITSIVTIKAIQTGDWRLTAPSSQLNISIGDEESFLVDYFPTKLSDLIGVAVQTSNTSLSSLDLTIISLSESQIYDFDIIPELTQQQENDILESLSVLEPSLTIVSGYVNPEPSLFIQSLNPNEISVNGAFNVENSTGIVEPIFGAEVCVVDGQNPVSPVILRTTDGQFACAFTNILGGYDIGPILNDDQDGSNLDVYVQIRTEHPGFKVFDSITTSVGYGVTTKFLMSEVPDGQVDFGTQTIDDDNNNIQRSFWIFNSFSKGYVFLSENISPSFVPRFVEVHWSESKNSFYFSESASDTGTGAHYHIESNVIDASIHLNGETTPASKDGGNANDPNTLLHEYGHHVMNDIYDLNGGQYPQSIAMPELGCGGPHSIHVASTEGCAWREGWASFFSIVVQGNEVYSDSFGVNENFETFGIGGSVDTGEVTEGRITASLWDAYDDTNESGDDLSNQLTNILDVFYDTKESSDQLGSASIFEDYWNDWKDQSLPQLDNILSLNTIVFHLIPETVNNLSGIVDSSTQITLSWNEPSNLNLLITGYKIEKGLLGFTEVAANHQFTTFTDTGLTENITYTYRVYAINSAGTGPFNEITVTTDISSSQLPQGTTQTTGATLPSTTEPKSISGTTLVSFTSPSTDVDSIVVSIPAEAINPVLHFDSTTDFSTLSFTPTALASYFTPLQSGANTVITFPADVNISNVKIDIDSGSSGIINLGYTTEYTAVTAVTAEVIGSIIDYTADEIQIQFDQKITTTFVSADFDVMVTLDDTTQQTLTINNVDNFDVPTTPSAFRVLEISGQIPSNTVHLFIDVINTNLSNAGGDNITIIIPFDDDVDSEVFEQPIADAGTDLVSPGIFENTQITLDGTTSATIPPGGSLDYSWTQISTGATIVFVSGQNTATPIINIPFVGTDELLVLDLQVCDQITSMCSASTSKSQLSITVLDSGVAQEFISNPSPTSNDNFGESVDVYGVDNDLLVGAPGKHITVASESSLSSSPLNTAIQSLTTGFDEYILSYDIVKALNI